ncbi:MAG: ATP-binding cassette domain-containing protein [Granulosicoccaceae bacterium]
MVIHAGQKLGLAGANGSGKSSLLAMIVGDLEPDDGDLSLQSSARLTHIAQETPLSSQFAIDYVIEGDQQLFALQHAIDQAVQGDPLKHAELLADFESAGGYRIQSVAGSLLNGLGFTTDQHTWSVSQFSGGWRMRLNLARALIAPSDLLLLDEPTNHLDLDAVIWLEQWLRQREGALILISHDREFLDKTTKETLFIEQESVTRYAGGYSEFEKLRAEQRANQQSAYESQTKRAAELQRFVDRFRAKATKAKQAQSRLKMLERMTELAPVSQDSTFDFKFHNPKTLPSPLLSLRGVDLGYADLTVLSNISMSIQPGDRIGLLGANGAGKSTLIKGIVGAIECMNGERVEAQKLKTGYFAQHQVDELDLDLSPVQTLIKQDPSMSESIARNFLGGFGFGEQHALKPAKHFSGGERARLALSLIVHEKPNLLLLDEPTNHLDMVMRQALSDALQLFDGALIVVSHDRTLLRTVADSLWLVDHRKVQPFDDDLDGYARWLNDRRVQQTPAQSGADSADANTEHKSDDKKSRKRVEAERRAQLKPLRRAVEKSEKQLERQSAELADLRDRLGSNELYSSDSKAKLTVLLADEAALQQQLETTEEQLLEQMQALELAEQSD